MAGIAWLMIGLMSCGTRQITGTYRVTEIGWAHTSIVLENDIGNMILIKQKGRDINTFECYFENKLYKTIVAETIFNALHIVFPRVIVIDEDHARSTS